MATFRVKFRLNPGRTGIALGKLGKQADNIEQFLRSLASDLGHDDSPNLWLAKDFQNGSMYSTAEYQAVVEASEAEKFNEVITGLVKYKPNAKNTFHKYIKPATVERFASLRQGLDNDETIGIATFDVKTEKAQRLVYVDRLKLEQIGQSVEPEVLYTGAIMGRAHDWNMGAKEPYIIIRELNTDELIKCIYTEADYANVAKLANKKSVIVIVEGFMTFNRITQKTEMTRATSFDLAPDFTDDDYQNFFGCSQNMTGGVSAAEYISKGRNER